MSEFRQLDNLTIEGARIVYRNFSGKAGKFNREGERSFCVVIDDPATAQKLRDDGWNVRMRPPRDEGDAPMNYIPVKVRFENYPPKVWMLSGKVRTLLDEEAVGTIDTAEIKNVDLEIRPYNWNVNDGSGVAAYLKTMYVTIQEDVFAKKYEVVEDDDLPF